MGNIALIVDNPQRDLRGLVLLAAELAARGIRSALVPMYLVHEVFALSPSLVVLNYVRTHSAALVTSLAAAGLEVAVLDTEGGVFSSLDHLFKILCSDSTTRSLIRGYCCWGSGVARPLKERGTFASDRVHITGCPRFDFYAEPWRQIKEPATAVASVAGPMLLVNGAFPLANPGYQTREQEAEMLVRTFGYDEAEVRGWQRAQDETIRAMIGMTVDLAREFPAANIVYRPHPFERMETYEAPFRDIPNIQLRREGTVDAWIMRASAVIQRNCSTAIEAGLAGVPAFLPAWIPTHVAVPAAEAVSIHEATFDSLTADIRHVLANDFSPPSELKTALHETISTWFHTVDGCSHRRVADVLEPLAIGSDRASRVARCRDVLRGVSPSAGVYERAAKHIAGRCLDPLRPIVRGLSSSSYTARFYKSDKYFDAAAVSRILDGLRTVPCGGSRFKDVHVRAAELRRDYHIGCTTQTSVVVEPILGRILPC